MTARRATVIVVETPGSAPPRIPTAQPIVMSQYPYGVERSTKAFPNPFSMLSQSIMRLLLAAAYQI
jgi:hypothetical protein